MSIPRTPPRRTLAERTRSSGPTARRARRGALLATLATLATALATLGCRDGTRASTSAAPPRAEFLLSAGDSTFWVTSDAAGVRVRSSPMFLARFGGRLYEIYATDDDHSYYDAVFTSQRIYRRDLERGDSLPVFDDAMVPALARRYAAAHPHERPLEPDDDGAEDPRTVATTEVSLVDVHGPYLTFDAHDDVDVEGGIERHVVHRSVVDLRTARATTLAQLFGDAAATTLAAAGRREMARALDSVRALADGGDETGARALHALESFRFADDNFGLAVVAARPAVLFVAVGRDADGHSVTLPLAPVSVPGAPPAWWDADVRDALPTTSRDSAELRWRLGDGEVVARYITGHDVAALAIRGGGNAAERVVGRGHEWPIARIAGPTRQLFALDRPRLAPTARRALSRAFNESALYGDQVISAAFHPDRDARDARDAGDARTVRRGAR
jgi:hypothetical protein